MPRVNEFASEYVYHIPERANMQEGKLYISMAFGIASHLCPCGCGEEIAIPFSTVESNNPLCWKFSLKHGKVSLYPSIGNYQIGCKSHYYIRDSTVDWL